MAACRRSFRWLRRLQTCVWVGKFSWNIKSIRILSVVQYGICPGLIYGLLTILLIFWTNICPCWIHVMYQQRPSVRVTRKSNGLMINAGMLLASSRRLIFGRPVITLWLTGKSLSAVKWELIVPTQRSIVSLVTETGINWWCPIWDILRCILYILRKVCIWLVVQRQNV